jgi:hypothetical protein
MNVGIVFTRVQQLPPRALFAPTLCESFPIPGRLAELAAAKIDIGGSYVARQTF